MHPGSLGYSSPEGRLRAAPRGGFALYRPGFALSVLRQTFTTGC